MPSPRRSKIARDIQQKLAVLGETYNGLPMPHDNASNKIRLSEWEEFRQRTLLHKTRVSDWEKKFGRPLRATAEAIWLLIEPSMVLNRGKFDSLAMTHFGWLTDEEKQELRIISKQALLIVLDTLITACQNKRRVNYNSVFDALCRKYSTHHRYSLAEAVRDMRRDTASKCRRDLLLNGIDVNKYWDIVVGDWSNEESGLNPFFRVDKLHGTLGIRVLKGDSVYLDQFENIVQRDPQYTRPHFTGIEALFADNKMPEKRDVYEICAEQPYNKVRLGQRSEELLRLQSKAHFLFDVTAFKEDYERERSNVKELFQVLRYKYDVNPLLSKTKRRIYDKGRKKDIWSSREKYLFYKSIEVGLTQPNCGLKITADVERELEKNRKKWDNHFDNYLRWLQENGRKQSATHPWLSVELIAQAATISKQWRQQIRFFLADYDRAQRHIEDYKTVYQQVENRDGLLPIRSGFTRVINRRYQPLHFWPTYVTSKDINILDDSLDSFYGNEDKFNSYRKRWFKAHHPDRNGTCELVGFDISSSQTQIIATFLGIEKLERLTMKPSGESFKCIMAKWAWDKHNSNDKFQLNQNSKIVPNYEGPKDQHLEELCKTLWMRVSYGGTVWKVIEAQQYDPWTYGPGWTWDNANLFLEYLYDKFPEVRTFLASCCRMAEVAYEHDPCCGVVFTDPLDGSRVRWNPTAREEVKVSNYGHKLILSLPKRIRENGDIKESEPDKNGDYPVDLEKLKRMVAPCLVHMLDAYYSSLVMEKLAASGVTDFVAIHDCWQVPENVTIGGTLCDGKDILDGVMKEAASDWYLGLEPVYADLLRYLASDNDFGNFIKHAYAKWKERVENGYSPEFLAKPS